MLHDSYGLLICRVALVSSNGMAEQPPAADCLQRPLVPRFRFRQRLRRSVDMTSDVKGWEPLFSVCLIFALIISRKSRSQEDATVDHAAIRGLGTTFLASVGCLPHSRDESPCRPLHAAEGDTTPGLRRCRERWETAPACPSTPRHLSAFGGTPTCLAMAHRQALHARARATTT
jgi:hypothetical protein